MLDRVEGKGAAEGERCRPEQSAPLESTTFSSVFTSWGCLRHRLAHERKARGDC